MFLRYRSGSSLPKYLEWGSGAISWKDDKRNFQKKQTLHGKLKTMKERIKTNLDGQDVSYDMYCNTTAVFKVYSVYK